MKLGHVIASPIVLIASPLERNIWSIVPKHMIDLVKHALLGCPRNDHWDIHSFTAFYGEMHTPTGFLIQHDSNTQNDIQDNQSGSGYIVVKPKNNFDGFHTK